MKKHLTDSMKARLYDFTYTPFMSAYLFSWIYWNSKLLLIFFDTNLTAIQKIELLTWNDINYLYPLYFSLFFVFIYPLATAIFYATTLGYKIIMNSIQQKMQDKTPLPQEKANKIIKENTELTNDIYELNLKLIEIKNTYKTKEDNLNQEIQAKEQLLKESSLSLIDNEVKEKTKTMLKQVNTISKQLADEEEKNKSLLNQNKQNSIKLKEEISTLKQEITRLSKLNENKANEYQRLLKDKKANIKKNGKKLNLF